MLKVLKNLKKSWLSVLFIVILLCVQAAADLALPDYTSKIVNDGIQAGGIEESVPEVIAKQDMDEILMFTEDDEQILDSYELVGNSESSYQEKILKKYLGKDYSIEENSVYVLKDLEEDKLINPMLEMETITSEQTSEQIKSKILENVQEPQKSYMQSLSLLEILSQMPAEQKEQILAEFTKSIDEMSDSIKEQAVISTIKGYYQNLNVDTDRLQNNYILKTGMQMLGIALISMASAVTIMLLSSRVAAKLGKTLRESVFRKVLSFSNAELNEFSTASLITRSTNDVQQIQMLIAMLFRVVVYAPIIGIGGFVKVLTSTDHSMAWIIGIAIVAIFAVIGTLFMMVMPRFRKLQDMIDKLNEVSREILTGLPVIRAFNKEKKEEGRFDDANKDLTKANIFVNRAMSMMMPLLMLIMNSITVLIVWIGGHNVDQGLMQVGDMMAFIQYTMQIVMAFLMISMISIMLPRASVSARRINEVIEKEPSIKDKKEVKKLDPNKKGLVEFKDVSFRYPDADTEILEDINFTAKPGETTAIIGSTGSGKSTIVNLIPRFYDITSGNIKIFGKDIKKYSMEELRKLIGIVPQRAALFSGTIADNMRWGKPDATDQEIISALKIAQAWEFVSKLTDGIKTNISQGGKNLSGGQRQRLTIARALVGNPPVVILDDSMSALDYATDLALRKAIESELKDTAVIMISQRATTLQNANHILVLDNGEAAGYGIHETLLKNCEEYAEIYKSQMS